MFCLFCVFVTTRDLIESQEMKTFLKQTHPIGSHQEFTCRLLESRKHNRHDHFNCHLGEDCL